MPNRRRTRRKEDSLQFQQLNFGPCPPHPGRRLQAALVHWSLSRREFANMIGVDVTQLDRVIRGELACSLELCILIAYALHQPVELWAHDQAEYDLWVARTKFGLPDFKPLPPRRPDAPDLTDRCLCGHWEWEHVDTCTISGCGCLLFIRYKGYLAHHGVAHGFPPEIRDEVLNASKQFAAEYENKK